jgi:hypothetical protein
LGVEKVKSPMFIGFFKCSLTRIQNDYSQ